MKEIKKKGQLKRLTLNKRVVSRLEAKHVTGGCTFESTCAQMATWCGTCPGDGCGETFFSICPCT